MATLVDADSALAVKVSRWLDAGQGPEHRARHSGRRAVHDARPRHLAASRARRRSTFPTTTSISTSAPIRRSCAAPTSRPSGSIRGASAASTAKLRSSCTTCSLPTSDKPLNLSLQERLTDRRVNVRALIARCLGNLGEFEPILKDLNDAKLASYWASRGRCPAAGHSAQPGNGRQAASDDRAGPRERRAAILTAWSGASARKTWRKAARCSSSSTSSTRRWTSAC